MADSTLTITYTELAAAVGEFLKYGHTAANWTENQTAQIDRVVQSGYRQFLYPPATEGVPPGYEWSFLKPVTTIDTIAPYDTGTVEVSSTTCTLTTGTWPSWAATHGTLVIDGTTYTITSRDSDSQLTVSASGDVTAGEEDWTLKHSGNHDMPDDFGRLVGAGFIFAANEQVPKVIADVGEAKIRELRQCFEETGRPRCAAIRIKAGTGTAGQRREVMWYPTPDDAYTMSYRFEAFVGKLTSTSPYPLGAMKHSELILLSCLASAESLIEDTRGVNWDGFVRSIASSIKRDMREGQIFFGNVGCKGEYDRTTHSNLHYDYSLSVSGNVIQ